jgi:cytochrome bd-type quinol oxidase subunit 2
MIPVFFALFFSFLFVPLFVPLLAMFLANFARRFRARVDNAAHRQEGERSNEDEPKTRKHG